MPHEKKLVERVVTLLKERGQKSVEISKEVVLMEKIKYYPLREALRYFMEEFWFDVLHPALISLACEAVGGKPAEAVEIGAAVVLLAGAADIHDDIIDQTTAKGTEQTVFGKFGRDIAILAGDALLLKGLYLLHAACEHLPREKKQDILEIIKRAFFEISSGEAKEASLRGKTDISKQDYLEIIKQKVAAAEATTRIGAILGNGTEKEVALMGEYGRIYGILMTVRDEFVDVFEPDELENRSKKECLPFPILLALHDASKKSEILHLLECQITEERVDRILDLSMDCSETLDFKREMKRLAENERLRLSSIRNCKDILELLLESTLEDL